MKLQALSHTSSFQKVLFSPFQSTGIRIRSFWKKYGALYLKEWHEGKGFFEQDLFQNPKGGRKSACSAQSGAMAARSALGG